MKATEMEVEGSSLPTSSKKETAGEVQMSSLELDVSVADTRTAKAGELGRGSKLSGQDLSIHPDVSLKEESCSDVTPSKSSEKPEKGRSQSRGLQFVAPCLYSCLHFPTANWEVTPPSGLPCPTLQLIDFKSSTARYPIRCQLYF